MLKRIDVPRIVTVYGYTGNCAKYGNMFSSNRLGNRFEGGGEPFLKQYTASFNSQLKDIRLRRILVWARPRSISSIGGRDYGLISCNTEP